MVTSELAPYARVSDAADAVGALAKTLRQIGHEVTLALPRYPGFEEQGLLLARRLTPLSLAGGGSVTLLDGQLSSGVRLVLFDAPELALAEGLGAGSRLDPAAEARRWGCLAQASAALVRQRTEQGTPFDVVHVHDWPGGLVPVVLSRLEDQLVPTLLTIHDLRRQGRFAPELLGALGLPADLGGETGLGLDDGLNVLKGGLLFADGVNLVSGADQDELRVDLEAGALVRFLEERALVPAVIGHGIDYAVYNPATDSNLVSRYDAEDPSRRGLSKTEVLRRSGLEVDLTRPLVVLFVDAARGFSAEVTVEALPELLRLDLSLLVAGELGADGRARLDLARGRAADRLAALDPVDEGTQRRLLAAADLAVFPARSASGGIPVLQAMRYGAVPVAHAIGAIGERVVDVDAELRTGTGFLFDELDAPSLVAAVARAVIASRRAEWPALIGRIMRQDTSWDRPARRYVQLYRQAIAAKA